MLNWSCVMGFLGLKRSMEQIDTELIKIISLREYLESESVRDAKRLTVDLCRQFYTMGWLFGTGGSVAIKVHDDLIPRSHQFIVMTPSGVQKQKMEAEDMYVLSPDGTILSTPTPKSFPYKTPKCSDCSSLFIKVFEMRNAGAVIYSHAIEACIITMIHHSKTEFRISNMEMIKGIQGHSYSDELVIPIIENAANESELTDPLTEVLKEYPRATAVLVRNHGVCVWGDNWISAKTQAECYHYPFDAVIKLHQWRLDSSAPKSWADCQFQWCLCLKVQKEFVSRAFWFKMWPSNINPFVVLLFTPMV